MASKPSSEQAPLPGSPQAAVGHARLPRLCRRTRRPRSARSIIDVEPQSLGNGVYLGQGRAKSGERFFVKMEKLTVSNQRQWEQYSRLTDRMTVEGRSPLSCLARVIEPGKDGGRYQLGKTADARAMQKRSGLDEEDFDSLIQLMGRNGFTGEQSAAHKRRALADTVAGSAAFTTAAHGSGKTQDEGVHARYVVYASSNPDFSIERLPLFDGSEEVTLARYRETYAELIMSVGSDLVKESKFENRGIFRNPLSAIEDSYKGISMVLHGFSAAVAKCFFLKQATPRPDGEGWSRLTIKPLSGMLSLIFKTLAPEDYVFIDNKGVRRSAADYPDLSMSGGELGTCYVKLDALDRYYREHPQKMLDA